MKPSLAPESQPGNSPTDIENLRRKLAEAEANLTQARAREIELSRELSQTKSLEFDLKMSQEKYQAIVNGFDGLIYVCSQDYRIEYMNPRFITRTGHDATGELCYRALHNLESQCPWCVNERVFSGETIHWEIQSPKDQHWFYIINTPIRHPDGKVSKQAMILDITDRKRAEEDLKASEEQYRDLVENLNLGISLIDTNHRIVMANSTIGKYFGVSPESMIGKRCHEEFEKRSKICEGCPGVEALKSGKLVEKERIGIRNDGTSLNARIRAFPIFRSDGTPKGFIEVVEDITQWKQVEEERTRMQTLFQQTQKLESLGILAGGIAHDFNNLLTAILGNIDLILNSAPDSPKTASRLQAAKNASQRAADLCKQMLAYSGKGKFQVETINMNEKIREMSRILEVSISKRVTLSLQLYHDLPRINGDPAQIQQILMNLVMNASEAIGDRDGQITISTGTRMCNRSFFRTTWMDEKQPDGEYVFIKVIDSGIGMDKATLERIFDPFFSTKFTGRGLGLASVLGIVRGHKGAIKINSKQGLGTTFSIFLPAAAKRVPPKAPPEIPDPAWRGKGTLLFVDDEEGIRTLVHQMLREAGFQVLLAGDGHEAVKVFTEHRAGITCVILDLVMPRSDGLEAFRELRKLDPGLKILLSSGYSEEDVTERFSGSGFSGFLQKPFLVSEVVKKIKTILETPA